jgi:hypothetical protein
MMLLSRLPAPIRERFERKRKAYAITFMDSHGRVLPFAVTVLADLKRFCGVDKGGIVISPVTRTADPIATAYRAGQRDVFLRITHLLRLDGADIHEEDSHDRAE